MKRLFIAITILPIVLGCAKPAQDQEPQNQEQEPQEQDPRDQPSGDPTPVIVEEPYLVTSEIIMQFIQNVTYDERDYSYTHVTDEEYASYGAPGDADLPPTVPISWELNGYNGALTLTLDDGEWSYTLDITGGPTSYELSNLVPGRTYNYTVNSTIHTCRTNRNNSLIVSNIL